MLRVNCTSWPGTEGDLHVQYDSREHDPDSEMILQTNQAKATYHLLAKSCIIEEEEEEEEEESAI
jgi:hypothetical protein